MSGSIPHLLWGDILHLTWGNIPYFMSDSIPLNFNVDSIPHLMRGDIYLIFDVGGYSTFHVRRYTPFDVDLKEHGGKCTSPFTNAAND